MMMMGTQHSRWEHARVGTLYFRGGHNIYCYIILVRSSYVISVSFGVYGKVEIVFIIELHKNRSIMLGSI